MVLKSTFLAVKNGQFLTDLPLLFNNITQAAEWLDKRSDGDQIRIIERLPTIGADGVTFHREVDVTAQCVDILMDYYNNY